MILGTVKRGLSFGLFAFILLAVLHLAAGYPESLTSAFYTSIAVGIGGAAGFALRTWKALR